MAKIVVSSYDKDFIREEEASISELLELIKRVSHFKVGDYVIGSQRVDRFNAEKFTPILDSYGNRTKFMIVYVNKLGMPYAKKLNNKGEVRGEVIPAISFLNSDCSIGMPYMDILFEVDPDYVDSIILQSAEFDPVARQRMLADRRKEILEYNKKHTLYFEDGNECLIFFKGVKPGTLFWKSNNCYMTFDSVVITPSTFVYNKGKLKGQKTPDIIHLIFLNKKGAKLYHKLDAICMIKLFTAQPRSLKELKEI